ncbi:MAG: hypothetical protein NTY53_12930 [Kiritimatiellaeota bacterium]|nr:hypothetical protein [Kiritimatiellota bacterium]
MKHTLPLLTVLLLSPLAFSAQQPQTAASVDKDGRSVTVAAPAVAVCSSKFSATVEINGKRHDLSSTIGSLQPAVHSTESTPYGEAKVIPRPSISNRNSLI